MVRQYQVVLDPDRCATASPHGQVMAGAIRKANQERRRLGARAGRDRVHGARLRGYLKTPRRLRAIPLMPLAVTGRPGAAARRGRGADRPEMRRGIAELDGEGEVTAASS